MSIKQHLKDMFAPIDNLDTRNMKRHPDYLYTYLFKEGEWNKVMLRDPVKINGEFVVDRPVERRLLTWVSTQDAWGCTGRNYWTSFEYRLPSENPEN